MLVIGMIAALAACDQSPADDASPAASMGAEGELGLTVSPEESTNYDRDDWYHWNTEDGCDTRAEILKDTGTNVETNDNCTVTAGQWRSKYDGETVSTPDGIEIDHIVPLAEAARSGTAEWSDDRREAFANDPDNLIAVSEDSNGDKSDSDPSSWMPSNEGYHCAYVERWVDVKNKYDMTVDQAEHDVLADTLATCG